MNSKYRVRELPSKEEVLKYQTMPLSIGDEAIYESCKKYPLHIQPEHIKAKIWLIGKSYSASLDRVQDKTKYPDTYTKISNFDMLIRWKSIDDTLSEIRMSRISDEIIPIILKCHKDLTDMFVDVSGLEKRSLASKYLHFHCPNMFYIYDSIAGYKVSSLTQKQRGIKASGFYDDIYEDFFYRVFELKNEIQKRYGIDLSPRQIDNFLLH